MFLINFKKYNRTLRIKNISNEHKMKIIYRRLQKFQFLTSYSIILKITIERYNQHTA